MNQSTDYIRKAAEIAQFRFAIIAPVIQGLYPDASQTAYFKRVTEHPLVLPDGSYVQYSYKTPEKWVSLYRRGGLEALMPKERSDKGKSRSLSDEAICEIFRIKQEFPRINATQIHAKLVQESLIPATVSVDAVQRFIRHNNLKCARDPTVKDRKAFEEDSFGKMWQCDTCYFPHITEDGQRRRVYCVMIIDDYSRLLVGGSLFYNDNAYNFQTVFKEAVATYGIPLKLMCDNGAAYLNEQLSMICVSIGTVLVHNKVHDPASKGKIERIWKTINETFLYTIDIHSIHSLAQFNSMLKDYMRTYNTKFHSGIQTTPMERYQNSREVIKVPPSMEWLDDCFLNRITRKVRKDSTVSIDSVSFDVPMQFISTTVEIRYIPNDMSSAFILFDGEKYPLRRTDKNENCRTKREKVPAIDYSKAGDQE